jgi:hypothetical protein
LSSGSSRPQGNEGLGVAAITTCLLSQRGDPPANFLEVDLAVFVGEGVDDIVDF